MKIKRSLFLVSILLFGVFVAAIDTDFQVVFDSSKKVFTFPISGPNENLFKIQITEFTGWPWYLSWNYWITLQQPRVLGYVYIKDSEDGYALLDCHDGAGTEFTLYEGDSEECELQGYITKRWYGYTDFSNPEILEVKVVKNGIHYIKVQVKITDPSIFGRATKAVTIPGSQQPSPIPSPTSPPITVFPDPGSPSPTPSPPQPSTATGNVLIKFTNLDVLTQKTGFGINDIFKNSYLIQKTTGTKIFASQQDGNDSIRYSVPSKGTYEVWIDFPKFKPLKYSDISVTEDAFK